jgi:hypothetical protein
MKPCWSNLAFSGRYTYHKIIKINLLKIQKFYRLLDVGSLGTKIHLQDVNLTK